MIFDLQVRLFGKEVKSLHTLGAYLRVQSDHRLPYLLLFDTVSADKIDYDIHSSLFRHFFSGPLHQASHVRLKCDQRML